MRRATEITFGSGAMTLAVLLAMLGCGGGSTGPAYDGSPASGSPPGSGSPAPGTNASVAVTNNRFSPSASTIARGGTVTWTWEACTEGSYGGSTCVSHSVSFDDGPSSSTQSTGTYARTFDASGTYPYHCTVHGAAMSGTVSVQ